MHVLSFILQVRRSRATSIDYYHAVECEAFFLERKPIFMTTECVAHRELDTDYKHA